MNWSSYELSDLLEVAECMGGLGLSVLFRLMAEDLGGHRGEKGGASLSALGEEGVWMLAYARVHMLDPFARCMM